MLPQPTASVTRPIQAAAGHDARVDDCIRSIVQCESQPGGKAWIRMTSLLAGIRNLIARKRESLRTDEAAMSADVPAPEIRTDELSVPEEAALSEAGFGARVEIEAKTPLPDFARTGHGVTDEAPVDHEVAQRLEEIDVRLGAAGDETRQLAKELTRHMESNLADVQRLIQKLDERIARLLELVGDRSNQPTDRDEAITAAVDAAAQRFTSVVRRDTESVNRMQAQLESMAEAGNFAGKQTDKLAFALDDIRERTTGLDEAITRIGQSIVQREGTFAQQLRGTRRSMMLCAYGCTLASLLALGIALVAIILV